MASLLGVGIGLGIFLLLLIVAAAVFWLLMLADSIRQRYDRKIMWIIIVLILGFIGAAAYYITIKRKLMLAGFKKDSFPTFKNARPLPKFKLPPAIQIRIDAWAKRLARSFPRLRNDLAQANMDISVEDFVSQTLTTSLSLSLGLIILAIIALSIINASLFFLVLLVPGILIVSFFYLLQIPKAKTKRVQREIDKEIVYAGRFLLIEITAGVPLFDALNNVARSYKKVGKYFYQITKKIESGTPIETALDEVIAATPSENFRKLLWQINNSLRTGSDVNNSLQSIIEQISREQLIEVQDYARKLNPMVMFYLMIAVIAPSLGITMLALLSTFIKLNISLGLLIGVAVLIAIIQFGFFSSIRLSRPGVEI